jgi:hypothetical protein
MKRLMFLSVLLLANSAALAAEPFPLVISPVPGRTAETEEDWAQMIPTADTGDEDPGCESPQFHSQETSPDGRYLYQMVCRWVTSDFIVRVDLQTGERRAVGAGNSLGIVRDGPYAGDLLVERHKYREGSEGGSYDPTYVVTPEGEELLMVPGSDGEAGDAAVQPWLEKNGWHAW